MPTPRNTVVVEIDADLAERLRARLPGISSARSRVTHAVHEFLGATRGGERTEAGLTEGGIARNPAGAAGEPAATAGKSRRKRSG